MGNEPNLNLLLLIPILQKERHFEISILHPTCDEMRRSDVKRTNCTCHLIPALIQSLFKSRTITESDTILLSIALSQNLVEGQSVLYLDDRIICPQSDLEAVAALRFPFKLVEVKLITATIRFLMFTLPINKDTAIPISRSPIPSNRPAIANPLLSQVLLLEQPPTDTFHGIIPENISSTDRYFEFVTSFSSWLPALHPS